MGACGYGRCCVAVLCFVIDGVLLYEVCLVWCVLCVSDLLVVLCVRWCDKLFVDEHGRVLGRLRVKGPSLSPPVRGGD
jgi:hypothetical protein